jgi:hypothetical protein
MLRKITLTALVAVLALATVAGAAERKGEFALGFSNSDAPVGVRYFTSDKVAIDVGLGFESMDVMAEGGTETATNFFVEGGLSYVVFDYMDSFFFVRPAIMYASFDEMDPMGLDSRLRVEANLGAEVRLAERFGLTFQHGLAYQSDSPQGDGDSLTTIHTFGENVTQAAVWFTF